MVLSGGAVIANLLSILAAPILTRLYSPEDFKTLAMFSSCTSIVAVAASLRFDLAIPIARDDREAMALLRLSAMSCALVAVSGTFISLVLLEGFFHSHDELVFVPLVAAFTALYSALVGFFLRLARYSDVSKSKLLQSLSMNSCQIGAGLAGAGPIALVIGFLLSPVSGCLFIGAKSARLVSDIKVTIDNLKEAIKAYSRYPKYSTIEAIANSAAIHAPIVMLAMALPGAEAAHVALAMSLLQVPMALVGNSVGQVFLSRAPSEHAEQRLPAFVASRLGDLGRIGFGPFIFAAIVAPEVFAILYGPSWQPAGEILAILVPTHFLAFLVVPVATSLHMLGLLGTALTVQVFGALLRIGSVAIAITWDAKYAVVTYAATGVLVYAVHLLVVIRSSAVSMDMLLPKLRSSVAWAALWTLPGLAIKILLHAE